MNRYFIILSFIILSFACEDEKECDSASCLASPEGIFNSGKVNLAIYGFVLEEQSNGSFEVVLTLDSVVVETTDSFLIKSFYTWVSIEDPENIRSFILYGSGEEIIIENQISLAFSPDKTNGYLLTFIKENDDYFPKVDEASEDLINGVCNDVIDISCL